MNPALPFNDLPSLLPAGVILETHGVLKNCIRARTALMELKTAADLIPNQSVLINVLPLLEARASTEVENIVTTNDELFRQAAMSEGRPDAATKDALNYRAALLAGYNSLRERPLCTATAVEVCCAIKNQAMEIRRVPGTRLANDWTGEVIYTPPEGESVLRDKLANWEEFMHVREDLDPLVRMAAAHYQFEAIHPFTDGNGRTGRVLNLLFLVSEGLMREPVLYLSRYILRNREQYYRLLMGVTRRQEWTPWLIFMLRGVEETARWTTAKIAAIRRLLDETAALVRREAHAIYSRELVEAIFSQVYCRIGNLMDADLGKRQTVAGYLRRLTELGVLREISVGREKLFLNQRFADLLFRDAEEDENGVVLREDPAEITLRGKLLIAVKPLKLADLPEEGLPGHEINGTPAFRRVLGSDRLEGRIRWLYLNGDQLLRTEGAFTWYDTRARSAERTGRSEWRFYYDEAFPKATREGDLLVLHRSRDEAVFGAVLAAASPWAEAARVLEAGETGGKAADLVALLEA
jgi:Fic family protein